MRRVPSLAREIQAVCLKTKGNGLEDAKFTAPCRTACSYSCRGYLVDALTYSNINDFIRLKMLDLTILKGKYRK